MKVVRQHSGDVCTYLCTFNVYEPTLWLGYLCAVCSASGRTSSDNMEEGMGRVGAVSVDGP